MSKAIQAFLSGIFFTFILDFFIFLSIKINYIDKYKIDLYYNILFADNQNIYIFIFFSIFIGYIVLYLPNKISMSIMIFLFTFVSLNLVPIVGENFAKQLFMKKNIILNTKKFSYHGDIYYIGRKTINFYDYDLKKVIILQKNEIKE